MLVFYFLRDVHWILDTIFHFCPAIDRFDKLWFSLVPDQVNLFSVKIFMNLDCSIKGHWKNLPDGLSLVAFQCYIVLSHKKWFKMT